jgi:hypothetical protein
MKKSNDVKKLSIQKQSVRDLKVRSNVQAGRGTLVTCVRGWCLPA